MNELTLHKDNLPQKFYKPSEIIGIFEAILAKQNLNAQVVFLRGVYFQKKAQRDWAYCYDILCDEDSQEELTIKITTQQRDNLKDGNLVMIGGFLSRSITKKGCINLTFNVSRIEIIQKQAVDEGEIKRMELRRIKASKGFKTVDSLLEQILYCDERPRIALVFAQTSITMNDFNSGINAAKSAIDFVEIRVNFSNSNELVAKLRELDTKSYTVIALIRGGGTGIEKLDDFGVLETIVNMNTATIAAVGHVDEKLFVKQIVDKEAPTPNGLGQYFSEIVEMVSEKKTKSRAAITEKIKKQFKDQLDSSIKQNKELQDKLGVLTKNQEETNKKYNEQVESAHKQNNALQNQLQGIQKTHKDQLDKLNDNQVKLQNQLKNQQEEANKRSVEMNANLTKFQETNTQLQKNLNLITAQNAESLKLLNETKEKARELERQLKEAKSNSGSNIRMIVAVIVAVIFFVMYLIK